MNGLIGGVARLAAAGVALLALAPIAHADHPGEPNLPALQGALGSPEDPVDVAPARVIQRAEPPLVPTPQAECGPGSRPETSIQGRVPRSDHDSGRAAAGYTCNSRLVGSYEKPNVQGSVAGFKVERYVDDAGRECAYYDSTLLYPTNVFDLEGGVNVLDMSDPAHPVRTARLVTPAMFSPHESLIVSKQRGVLAAVLGNPLFNVGIVDLYDISEDCRHPVLKSSTPVGVFGHESGMAPDGKTFYSASPGSLSLVAIDITNLSLPTVLGIYGYDSHGLTVGRGGDRAYIAGVGSGLIILDTSAVQARKPSPQVVEKSRLTWAGMSIPQNAIPVTIRGKDYVVEIDEYGGLDEVGAARLISVEDETNPRVVSNLRLEVHQPENFGLIRDDPQATNPLQGYAAHYCNVPRREDPGIVACSMILSGLRVFDVRDPRRPREIAYYNAPIKDRTTPAPVEASNWAMSSPSFAPKRGEIWYSDGFQGFFNVKLTNGAWPFPKCRGRTATVPVVGRRTNGTRRADVIVGTRRAERIRGGRGRDLICARGKNDRLAGGAGRDVLVGGWGADRIRCGRGRDVAYAGRNDLVARSCEQVRLRP